MIAADTDPMPLPAPPLPPSGDDPLPTLGAVVARLSADVTVPLTQALERVQAIGASGRLDRSGLAALRDEIDAARRIGLRGQQIVRLATGQVQPHGERLGLKQLLEPLLDEARRQPGSAPVRWHAVAEVRVEGDASLLHTLLRAASDWSQALARGAVDWWLDRHPTSAQGRVRCRFVPREGGGDEPLDWLLLQYSAHLAGVQLRREQPDGQWQLTLHFPNPVNEALPGASALEIAPPGGGGALLAGSQLLVLAARRELRQQVRAALRGHELFIDHVPTVADAQRYCDEGLPQVLVYETSFAGAQLQALLARLAAAPHPVAVVELVPGHGGCALAGPPGAAWARLGTEGLAASLAAVVALEMARRR